jgi:predicted lipid carrier protein YhbT
MDRTLRPVALRLLLQSLPAGLVRPALDLAVTLVLRRHRTVMERLEPWAGTCLVIAPLDLSRALALELAAPPRAPRLWIAAPQDFARAAAVLRGPLRDLLDLLEGRADGDALFFSRSLSIEGDTEAVLALRNALDGEAIDLVDDVLEAFGPLAGIARRIVADAEYAARRLGEGVAALQAFLAAPVLERCDRMSAEIAALRDAIGEGAGRPRPPAPAARRNA